VDQATDSGRTPLFVAADADRTEAVKLLIDRGAKVDQALKTGETPLIAACRNGSAACAALLLDHGANPNAAGARGTALTYAARAGSPECLRLLLAKDADVKKAGPKGLTPLMAAVGSPRDAECVRLLLDAGADVAAKDSAGQTAYDYALKSASAEVISMLACVTVSIRRIPSPVWETVSFDSGAPGYAAFIHPPPIHDFRLYLVFFQSRSRAPQPLPSPLIHSLADGVAFPPVPVLRERVRVRVLRPELPVGNPHPCPLPAYREREDDFGHLQPDCV
jgi:ankyrin repeat protein